MTFNLEKNFISAVVYTKNDGDNLTIFLKTIAKILSTNFEHYEIIVVNDHSADNVSKAIDEFSKKSDTGGSLSVVNMSFSEGVELSMNAGVDFAIGDFIYEFDSCVIDYPKSIIMDLYHKALEDNDIVVASPNAPIRISSKLFYYLFNKNSLLPQKLTTESIMLLSRRAINRINNQSVTIPYRKAIYARSGLNKATLSFTPIQPSSKSQSYKYRQGIAIDTLILFTNIAYKVAISMSALMMAILLVSAIYAIATFISGQAVAGWTTTILLISFAFFGIFAVLTIVIKYLSLITNLIFRKQTYTIRSTEKFNI